MIKKIAFLAIAALLMTACAFSLPGKFTQLADKAAAKGADWSPAQWEKANAQFEKLVQQYVDKYDKLSNEDKKEINAAIGKYTATALKCGVSDGLKQINALLKQVPNAIDTAVEGAKGFFEELGL
jgi:C-terminal processing protease CtpA/Prc